MVFSMTGFGQAERSIAGFKLQMDLKSVNHRYCEVVIRLPREWAKFEDALRRTIQQQIKRGRVDAFVSVEREAGAASPYALNQALAEAYASAAAQLKAQYSLADDMTLSDLLRIPDLVAPQERPSLTDDEVEPALLACAAEALDGLTAMRRKEGAHLLADLQERLEKIVVFRNGAAALAPKVVRDYADKLRARMQELLQTAALDETRLAMEAALFADRSSIDEELTRLLSHVAQFRELLSSGEPVGRKLDFLVQEMNREVNTIGSKANHGELTAHVVEMKAELEKMREQIQNIE